MVSKKVYFTTLAVIVIILGGLNVFGAAPFHYLKDIVKNDGTQVDANNDGVIDASALAQNSN
ncbi:hypothetical protein HY643_03295, partial [Candidatus Woesearchaeota archaeon]|nr:hypothetical protein [Candidatus Woesearchaeota archaeon]